MENKKIYSELTFTKEQIRLALEQAEGIIENEVLLKYGIIEKKEKQKYQELIIAYKIAFTKALFGIDGSTIKN